MAQRDPAPDEKHAGPDSILVWPPSADDRIALPVGLHRGNALSPETKAALDALSPGADGAASLELPFRAGLDARRNPVPEPAWAEREPPEVPRQRFSLRRLSASDIVILGLSAIVLAQTFFIGWYAWKHSAGTPAAAAADLTPTAGAAVTAAPAVPENQLVVSTPDPGAIVYVDGRLEGASPVTLTGVTPGSHRVRVEAGSASIEEDVTINAGNTTLLMTPVASPTRPSSGWVVVSAPAELQVFERGKSIGSSVDGPLALSAGVHRLELRADQLGYRQELPVTIRAGDIARIRPVFPDGVLQVNAQPWASVWVDGKSVGDTPLGNLRVALGPHEVTFRHPELGEQVRNVTVSANNAARISVDLRR